MRNLPKGPFKTILADPPWPSPPRDKIKRVDNTRWQRRGAPLYPTMTAKELLLFPIQPIIHEDAVLVLWSTWMHLALAHAVISAWGFRYCTGIPWLKVQKDGVSPIFGPGMWFMHCTEIVLIGRRGRPFPPPGNPTPARKGLIIAQRQEHSRKPDELHEWIESAKFPKPRIELFARRKRPGWTVWGNEV